MIASFLLPTELRASIAAEARAAFPRECCGLIEGECAEGNTRAVAIHPARNLASAPDSFEIDPAAQFALLRRLRGSGRDIIGCYHSHPNGKGEPSARDEAGASEEGFVWLIAAVGSDGAVALSAHRRAPNGFERMRVVPRA